MQELTLQEQKDVAVSVLSEIDEICRKNNFIYSLAYGTLLGAIRHNGFIPWDDDIDIMMPREDYLRFIDYCKNNKTNFELASSFTDPDYGYIFSKACDKETIVIPGNMKWKKHGIQVDIFPIENLGDDIDAAKKEFMKKRFQRQLLVAWNWERFEKNKNKSFSYNTAKFIFFVMSRFASNKRLAKSIHNYYGRFTYEKKQYGGIVCGAYQKREIMPMHIYEEYTDVIFEGKHFKAIAKYDEYLTIVYGDYMKLPPEEKRVTHHNFKAYRKQTGGIK